MTRPRKHDHGRTQARAAGGRAAIAPESAEKPAPEPAVEPVAAPVAEPMAESTVKPNSESAPTPAAGDSGQVLVQEPQTTEPTPEQALRRERDEFQEKWLRALAELDNVRKRSRREVVDARRLALAELLRGVLDVHDNFARALQSLRDNPDPGGAEGIRQGVELIFQKLQGVLKDSGTTPIEALGREFDPVFHDAVGQIPREGVPPGTVIEIVQEGFMLGEMVLRPARVILSS